MTNKSDNGLFLFTRKDNFMQLFGGDQEYLTEKDLYNLLGIKNQLTDDEMNISKALMSDAAKKAISNINYSNGVNTFHYYGVSGYEGVNWLFQVSPNTNYRMVIVAHSTSEITALDNTKPYIPWVINSKEDLNDSDSTYGDVANGHLPLPWSGWTSESIFFNSGSYNNLYLNTNFGFIDDEVDTDIILRIKLFKADSIQDQIDSSFSTRDTQINGLVTRTNNIESGVISNTRTINILSHEGNNLVAHDNATIMAQTEYIKTDSTLSDYGAVANSGKVGEAIKQTYLLLNASLNQLVADYDSTHTSIVVGVNNDITNLQNQINQQNQTIQSLVMRLTSLENKVGGTSA